MVEMICLGISISKRLVCLELLAGTGSPPRRNTAGGDRDQSALIGDAIRRCAAGEREKGERESLSLSLYFWNPLRWSAVAVRAVAGTD